MHKYTIAIEGRFLGREPSGIRRFCENLVLGLGGNKESELRIIVFVEGDNFEKIPGIDYVSTLKHIHPRLKALLGKGFFWHNFVLPYWHFKLRPNVYIFTSFVSPVWKFGSKSILAVHDISHRKLDNAKGFFYRKALDTLIQFGVKKADRIWTISHTVKKDLIQTYGIAGKRIDVIYLSPFKLKDSPRPLLCVPGGRIPGQILFVGRIESRKNIQFLIKLYDACRDLELNDIRFVIVGNKGYHKAEELLSQIKNRSGPFLEYRRSISDADLIRLYQTCDLFILPSLDEGYGLPVIEAMSHGLVPILSPIEVFKELFAQGSIFLTPEEMDQPEIFANRLNDFLKHKRAEIEKYRFECKRHADSFSLTNMTTQVMNSLSEIRHLS